MGLADPPHQRRGLQIPGVFSGEGVEVTNGGWLHPLKNHARDLCSDHVHSVFYEGHLDIQQAPATEAGLGTRRTSRR